MVASRSLFHWRTEIIIVIIFPKNIIFEHFFIFTKIVLKKVFSSPMGLAKGCPQRSELVGADKVDPLVLGYI